MAQSYNFSDVQALIIEHTFNRMVIRRALNEMGISNIFEFTEIPAAISETVDLTTVDLIVANVNDDFLAPIQLINNIRRKLIPCNPFTGVIVTSGSSTPGTIQSAVNSGIDGMLLKPYAPAQVQEQVAGIVERRRPFIVTADYIGPERRNPARATRVDIPYFDVPNSLALKTQRVAVAQINEAIKSRWVPIDRELISRLTFQIFFLVRLMQKIAENPDYGFARKETSRLPVAVKQLSNRLRDNDRQDVGATLTEWVSNYPKLSDEEARQKSRQEIEQVLANLMIVFDNTKTTESVAVEAETALKGFFSRMLIPASAQAS